MSVTQETTQSQRMALLHAAREQMELIKKDHPDWHADFEDVDPFVADRPQVEQLLKTAPTAWASGYVTGIFVLRQQIAIVSGREF